MRGRARHSNHLYNRAIVRDVLAVLGTPASVKVIAQLVSSGEVSGVEETVLLGSFALIVNPTPEMIHAIVVGKCIGMYGKRQTYKRNRENANRFSIFVNIY